MIALENRPRLKGSVANDQDVIEFSLLLPQQHALLLESLAHCQGISMGNLMRQLISDYVDARTDP